MRCVACNFPCIVAAVAVTVIHPASHPVCVTPCMLLFISVSDGVLCVALLVVIVADVTVIHPASHPVCLPTQPLVYFGHTHLASHSRC